MRSLLKMDRKENRQLNIAAIRRVTMLRPDNIGHADRAPTPCAVVLRKDATNRQVNSPKIVAPNHPDGPVALPLALKTGLTTDRNLFEDLALAQRVAIEGLTNKPNIVRALVAIDVAPNIKT